MLYYNDMLKRGSRIRRQRQPGLWRRGIRAFAVALALLFAGAQFYALAHGAAFGTDAHEHNGAACHVPAVANGLTGMPAAPVAVATPDFGAFAMPVWRQARIRPADLRERKPIRAPPSALS